jgi:hypothetical protein
MILIIEECPIYSIVSECLVAYQYPKMFSWKPKYNQPPQNSNNINSSRNLAEGARASAVRQSGECKQSKKTCWSICNIFKKKRSKKSSVPIIQTSGPGPHTIIVSNDGDLSSAYSSQIHSPAQSIPNSPGVFALIDYEIKTPAWARLPSTNSLGRESKFKEELEITTDNFEKFLIKRDASGMFAKAIKATEKEREAFLLPEHKHLSRKALIRPRSASYCPPQGPDETVGENQEPSRPIRSHSDSHLHNAQTKFLTADYTMHYGPGVNAHINRSCQQSLQLIDPHGRLDGSDKVSIHADCTYHSHNKFLSPDSALLIESTSHIPAAHRRRKSLEPRGPHDLSPDTTSQNNAATHAISLNSLVRHIMTLSSSTESSATHGKLEPFPLFTNSLTRADSEESKGLPGSNVSGQSIDLVINSTEGAFGAWSRYPSHTRSIRTGSAGKSDNVWTGDFEFATNPSTMDDANGDRAFHEADKVKGKARQRSHGKKKFAVVQKGKEVVHNYRDFFTSPSLDYLRYGYGRRSSISPGGSHAEPDLELLPEV